MKTKKAKNVCLEFLRPDGSSSLFTGELVGVEKNRISIRKAAWIADTGRRHLFMAGHADNNAEIEPYPDEMKIDLPLHLVIIMDWPHVLPRDPR